VLSCAAGAAAVGAQSASLPLNLPPAPTIGSANTAVADLLVSRPATTPCVVDLFDSLEFADFSAKTLSYVPPAACPGPWAKVVYQADFYVTAGVQYDRSAQVLLGGVNLMFGTTPEPRSSVSPSWHVERDVTDYSALFGTVQSGIASIGNLVNSTYTGIIYGSGQLVFYPVSDTVAAARVPDVVLPLNGEGGATGLSSSDSQMAQTFTLPRNIEAAYLDVIAQSQSGDEFWYACVPNDVASELYSCGNTGFREVEISVDGAPAAAAPVSPWIYTGGLSPYLWTPIPGVQTLNFPATRVDLTPFAGVLSDGQQHTVAVSVLNANSYFAVTGTLLLYLDAGSTQTIGAVTTNTITAPAPVISENLTTSSSGVTGTVGVSSARLFTVAGYVITSHGTVTTQIRQTLNFANHQQYETLSEVINLSSAASTVTTTTTDDGVAPTVRSQTVQFPLYLYYSLFGAAITQVSIDDLQITGGGTLPYHRRITNSVSPSVTDINFGPGSQVYRYVDSTGLCYDRTIKTKGGAVSKVINGAQGVCGK
jgi:hypothetical protein